MDVSIFRGFQFWGELPVLRPKSKVQRGGGGGLEERFEEGGEKQGMGCVILYEYIKKKKKNQSQFGMLKRSERDSVPFRCEDLRVGVGQ